MTVLFIRGVNDANTVKPILNKDGQIGFESDGCCNVYRYMDIDRHYLIIFPDPEFKAQFYITPSLVFNEISDADSHQKSLAHCANICDALNVPIINHPEKILRTTRDNVAQTLQGISNVVIPKTVRCQPRSPDNIFAEIEKAGLEFPVIVRTAGVHNGESNVLLQGKVDLGKLHVYPFDGSWFYLTQYIDYQSEDGLYRKYRIVVVDGNIFFRHFVINSNWMVHASSFYDYMKNKPELMEEANKTQLRFDSELQPLIASSVQQISERLGLEYFGIDCHINNNGEMLIFEANANMNVFYIKTPIYTESIEKIKQQLKQMILTRAAKASTASGA